MKVYSCNNNDNINIISSEFNNFNEIDDSHSISGGISLLYLKVIS